MIILGLLKRLQTKPKHHPSNEVQSQQQHLAVAATQKQHMVQRTAPMALCESHLSETPGIFGRVCTTAHRWITLCYLFSGKSTWRKQCQLVQHLALV